MRFDEAVSFLSRFTNYERQLRYPYDGWSMNLDRVRVLLDKMGSPDQGLRAVHVAGSKGKGSTAAMIESMARAAGFRTGLYTSPHLVDFRERIRLSGELISEDLIGALAERLVPAVGAVHERRELGPVTYFEILTALAFAAFAEAGVDLAVLEAGLGGRWDATNICVPLVSVLTPVSLDHTDILGPDIQSIAIEKSMIIKPGAMAVLSRQPADALAIFEARCKETGTRCVRGEERYSWRRLGEDLAGQRLLFSGARRVEARLPLLGDHQADNAAVAITVMDLLRDHGLEVDDEAVTKGLAGVKWPARFEVRGERPWLVLDGAHNADSAAHLARTVRRLFPGRRVWAVMGMGSDKDVEGFCKALGPALFAAVLTRSRAMKAVDMDRVREALLPFKLDIHETEAAGEALELALSRADEEDVVLVTGSFYVISDALAALDKREPAR